jgi:DNA-binding NarL/FixJ family response regulator
MKRARVLLADDHADVAEQLRSILEADFEVVAIVGDGSALLAAADVLKPDVIVSDIAMPGMNGIEATLEILLRTPDARVVLITSHDETFVRRRALATGALGFVPKLRADEDLLPAVHAVCRGELFVGGRAGRQT